jgi:hypothetical protein
MHKEDVKARAIAALENIVFVREIPCARESLFTDNRFVCNCSAATDFGIAEIGLHIERQRRFKDSYQEGNFLSAGGSG